MRRTITSISIPALVVIIAAVASRPVEAASGGPDAAGYRYVDQADGAVYTYVNIVATGVSIASGDDVLSAPFDLAAPFTFYGEDVTQLVATTNGFLSSTAVVNTSTHTNTCPLPAAQSGGGFRIAPLHDDLISTVYSQYFDAAAAAAVGYPGEAAGITVFQWVGDHYPAGGGDNINVEAILFHDDSSILTMVQLDFETGGGSTIGIQNADANIGLTYNCNSVGGDVPGVTAVLYTIGEPPPPDSDCCTPSEANMPFCIDDECSAAVCAFDPFCCEDEWDLTCANEALETCAVCAVCGDGNIVGAEECDDAGESAACDVDCTFVSCGDGTTNTTAGEECDDAAESATCDGDCSAAACGDGVVNPTAGEACDDAGESATCNEDCSAAACGDGVLNPSAGEECDDSNTDAGDGCAPDCTQEDPGTTTGEESSSSDGGETTDGGESSDSGATTEGGETTDGGSADETGADESSSSGAPDPTNPTDPTDPSGPDDDTSDSDGDDGSSSGTAGESTDTEGCGCTTGDDDGRGVLGSLFAMIGLGALRRRRRS